jgi:L-lactate dehydrogenase complex protein LldE
METRRATLFIQCLVDSVWPNVAEAMERVLRSLGVALACPAEQTCCGQPAFNAGYRREARRAARRFIEIFEGAEAIVCPSGSCVHLVRHHYPGLFGDDPAWAARARGVAGRVFEFSEYLVDVLGVEDVGARYAGRITYHDSCHLLRGLRVREQPRRLLRKVAGAEFVELDKSEACCGFGGSFAFKYPDISGAMVADKVRNIAASGADTVVGCDTGCLLNIAGAISRLGLSIRTRHIAEILAGPAPAVRSLRGAGGGVCR